MKINSFSGKYEFLSNFYPRIFVYNRRVWKTSEHAFQAMKTLDKPKQEKIRLATTPGRAKRAGRKVLLRPDWEQVKEQVMLDILRAKFTAAFNQKRLGNLLVMTGDVELVEGNHWHDNEWGDCHCGLTKCKEPGKNILGILLMQVRDELKGI